MRPFPPPAAMLLALAALLLSGCEPQAGAVRPGMQPLDKLVTAEVRRRSQAASNLTPANAREAAGMCAEVLRVSEQGRLILDRSQAGRLVVDQALWARVPETAQQAIVRCAQISPAPNQRPGPVTVVPSTPSE